MTVRNMDPDTLITLTVIVGIVAIIITLLFTLSIPGEKYVCPKCRSTMEIVRP